MIPITAQYHVLTALFEAYIASASIIEVGAPKTKGITNIIIMKGMGMKHAYGCFRKVKRESSVAPRLITMKERVIQRKMLKLISPHLFIHFPERRRAPAMEYGLSLVVSVIFLEVSNRDKISSSLVILVIFFSCVQHDGGHS